jgi:uncharacterized membrane-anchored protein
MKVILPWLLLLVSIALAHADDAAAPAAGDSPRAQAISAAAQKFEASLHFQSGPVSLPEDVATLNLSSDFRFLDAADAKRVLTEAWGNPPEATRDVIGMVFPSDLGPLSQHGWGVVISYEKDGYVKDSDAASINYDELLKEMQTAAEKANAERTKQGYPAVRIAGWAERPYYDKDTHKLYWAKELRFSDAQASTLNYDIRVLGRYGVLSMNAVAEVSQLSRVKDQMQQVMAFTDFNPGHRYAEFNGSTDKVAAYGLAALVAGGVAAKLGLFAKLGVLLLAFKKAIILGIAGAGAALAKLFKRSSAEA